MFDKIMRKIAKLALISSLVFSSLLIIIPSQAGSVVDPKRILGELKGSAEQTFETGGDPKSSLGKIFVTGLQVTIGLLGVVAVILIIYSGVLWMTAGGNDEQIKKAKKVIIQAIIGIIIITLTYAIIAFVLSFFVET